MMDTHHNDRPQSAGDIHHGHTVVAKTVASVAFGWGELQDRTADHMPGASQTPAFRHSAAVETAMYDPWALEAKMKTEKESKALGDRMLSTRPKRATVKKLRDR